jgi:hypothetical protein
MVYLCTIAVLLGDRLSTTLDGLKRYGIYAITGSLDLTGID